MKLQYIRAQVWAYADYSCKALELSQVEREGEVEGIYRSEDFCSFPARTESAIEIVGLNPHVHHRRDRLTDISPFLLVLALG